MTIEERFVGGVVILDIDGRIGEDDADEFHLCVQDALSRGRRRIVLNVAAVPYLDSTALGEIARAYTSASRLGGTVKLLHVCPRVQQLLAITRLDRVLESFDGEESAVRSFDVPAA